MLFEIKITSIISFEKSITKIFESFTITSSNKKLLFYNFLKSSFFVSHYQIFLYEIDDDIIKIFYINNETKNTLFN